MATHTPCKRFSYSILSHFSLLIVTVLFCAIRTALPRVFLLFEIIQRRPS